MDSTLEQLDIYRTIFQACDVDNRDLVPVLKLIEFIQPYLMEDLNALEDLRLALDPNNSNTLVSSDKFYQVMSCWSKKISSASSLSVDENTDFKTPSKLNRIEDKDLPYTHSTPRASLGDKLLKCRDLLNLSNVSGYSLSSSRLDHHALFKNISHNSDLDKTLLEEKIKELEFQVSKTTNELFCTKQQLAESESQNEQLQKDLENVNRQLHEKTQLNDHLQKDIKFNEDLKEEVSQYRKNIEELHKKLSQSEKDSLHHKHLLDKVSQEREMLEKELENVSKKLKDCVEELREVKTEYDIQINELSEECEGFKLKYSKQMEEITKLEEENEILKSQKSVLVKRSKAKSYVSSNQSDLVSIQQSLCHNGHNQGKYQPIPLLRKVLSEQSSLIPRRKSPINSGDIKEMPNLSPIIAGNCPAADYQQDSSEEDCYYKMQPAAETGSGNRSINDTNESLHSEIHQVDPEFNDVNSTALFLKDERIVELETELEKVMLERDDLVTQLNKQKICNDKLTQDNFTVMEREECARKLNEALGGNILPVEKDGAILECKCEACVRNVDLELQFQEAKIYFEKELKLINENKFKIEQELVNVSTENNGLRENIVSLMQALELSKMEYEQLKSKLHVITERLKNLSELYDEQCKQNQQYQETKLKLENEFHTFKETLEKKLVAEFEDKVKSSMGAQEKILQLTQRLENQEDEFKHLSDKLSIKAESLATAERRLELVNARNELLRKEIADLNSSKMEYEVKIVRLKSEFNQTVSKIDNIDVVTLEIQNHIRCKNEVIEELKELNRKLNSNLVYAQSDLREKINNIFELKDELTKGLDVKNELWKKVKILERDVASKLSKIDQLSISNKELQIDYNNLLIAHDHETEKVLKLETERDKLDRQLEAALTKIAEETEKNKLLETQINGLHSIKESSLMEFEETFRQVRNESDQILKDLKQKLNEEVSKNRNLIDDLVKMKNDVTERNAELSEIRQRLALNEAEMTQKLEKYNILGAEFDKAKLKINQLEEELGVAMEKNHILTQEVDDRDNRLRESNERCQGLSEELNQMQIYSRNIEKDLEVAKHSLIVTKQETIHLSEIDLELKQTKETLEKERENSTELKLQLKQCKQLLQNKIEELTNSEHKLELTRQQLEEVSREMVEEIAKLRLELSEKNLEVNMLENVKEQLNTTVSQTNVQILKIKEEFQEEKNCLMKEIDDLKEELLKASNYKKINQRLQEELAKNKALFDNFTALKQDRDKAGFDLKECRALLLNNQVLCNKKQSELQQLQLKYTELQTNQTEEYKKLESRLKKSISDREILIQERDTLKMELARLQNSCDGISKRKSYSRMEKVVKNLEDKIDDLSNKLRMEKTLNVQLKSQLAAKEDNVLRDESESNNCQLLRNQCEEADRKLLEVENKLKIAQEKLDIAELAMAVTKVTCEIGIQVGADELSREKWSGKHINKFTLCGSESPDSPSADIEFTNLKLPTCSTKLTYGFHNESILEIPSLDVKTFADDLVNELDLSDSSPRKKLERQELEEKVTALTLGLVAKSNTISHEIENQTEQYRCQYEAILSLIMDISYRLRNHVCIGTAEPIIPVYVLLEEVKIELKKLVQNSGQIGVLIGEDRMKRCWNLVINYMAVLRQDNEVLQHKMKETTPTQTGPVRRRNRFTQDDTDNQGDTSRRRSYGRCSKISAFLILTVAFAVAVSLVINFNCRMTAASENQYCPLDGLAQRINVGLPPM